MIEVILQRFDPPNAYAATMIGAASDPNMANIVTCSRNDSAPKRMYSFSRIDMGNTTLQGQIGFSIVPEAKT